MLYNIELECDYNWQVLQTVQSVHKDGFYSALKLQLC